LKPKGVYPMKNKRQRIHIQSEGYNVSISTTSGNIIAPVRNNQKTIINVDDRPFQYVCGGEVWYRCDVCSDYHTVGHPHFA